MTGWSAGLTFWYTGGVGIWGGSSGAALAMADCTSWAAPSIERSSENWMVMAVRPWALDDVIESMPAIVVNCFSSGVATADAMVSGLAAGSAAATWIVGKSTFGRSLTGRSRKPMIPKSRMAAIRRVVRTGRRMKRSVLMTPWTT